MKNYKVSLGIILGFHIVCFANLNQSQDNQFRELIDILPTGSGSHEYVIDAKLVLQDLYEGVQNQKISLVQAVEKLQNLANRLENDPRANISFADKSTRLTLYDYSIKFLRPLIKLLQTQSKLAEQVPQAKAVPSKVARLEFQQLLDILPLTSSEVVADIKIGLEELFIAAENKNISTADLVARLTERAKKLETDPRLVNIQFPSSWGTLTLSEFAHNSLRPLISQLEKESLAKPTPITPTPPAPTKPSVSPTPKPSAQPVPVAPRGLKNIGNSCFMNATLQNFFALDQLSTGLIDRINTGYYKAGSLASEYINFINTLTTASEKIMVPQALCTRGWAKMGFERGSQQDNDEFLIALLDDLIPNIEKDPLARLLAITLQPYTDNRAGKPERTLFLSLPIPSDATSLQDCLKAFTAVETVQETGQKRQFKIMQTSKYFIVHLKRNVAKIDPQTQKPIITMRGLQKEKISKALPFPMHLNLNPYAGIGVKLPLYQLKGMVIHAGSAEGGHYTGYVRYGDTWYFVNDEEVKSVSAQEVERITQQGYGSDVYQTPTTFFYEQIK